MKEDSADQAGTSPGKAKDCSSIKTCTCSDVQKSWGALPLAEFGLSFSAETLRNRQHWRGRHVQQDARVSTSGTHPWTTASTRARVTHIKCNETMSRVMQWMCTGSAVQPSLKLRSKVLGHVRTLLMYACFFSGLADPHGWHIAMTRWRTAYWLPKHDGSTHGHNFLSDRRRLRCPGDCGKFAESEVTQIYRVCRVCRV